MQETETESNLDHNLLSLPGFDFESETNNVKARVAVYIKSSLSYIRKRDLEGCGLHIIIIDLKCDNNLRLINIYRSFNPQDGSTAREFFHLQINKVRAAFTENTILLGDFNLDWQKKCTQTYQYRNYFEYLLTSLNDFSFTQMVKFPTWSRNVNNVHRESVLDHVYVTNPCFVTNLGGNDPYFGDHKLISFNYATKSTKKNRHYSKGAGATMINHCFVKNLDQ